jgi:hypothetical protein
MPRLRRDSELILTFDAAFIGRSSRWYSARTFGATCVRSESTMDLNWRPCWPSAACPIIDDGSLQSNFSASLSVQ